MLDVAKRIQDYMRSLVLNKKRRRETLLTASCILLSAVAAFMTVVNIITNEIVLMYITLSFTILCIVSAVLNHTKKPVLQQIAKVLFVLGMFLMFAAFIITGYPDGFSVIWSPIVPMACMLVFEMTWGVGISIAMWFMLIFFFWTPVGKSLLMYEYGTTFMTRFPMLYFAAFAIGVLLAGMCFITQRALSEAYSHDVLTDTYNRVGFMESINDIMENREKKPKIGFIIADIDHFKDVNDNYSHFAGDKVLKNVADIMMNVTENPICRWGGEEFAIFVYDGDAKKIADDIRKAVEESVVVEDGNEIRITISLGVNTIPTEKYSNPNEICKNADKALYEAKANGRNCVVVYNGSR